MVGLPGRVWRARYSLRATAIANPLQLSLLDLDLQSSALHHILQHSHLLVLFHDCGLQLLDLLLNCLLYCGPLRLGYSSLLLLNGSGQGRFSWCCTWGFAFGCGSISCGRRGSHRLLYLRELYAQITLAELGVLALQGLRDLRQFHILLLQTLNILILLFQHILILMIL